MYKSYLSLFLAVFFSSASHADVNIVTTIKPLQLIAESVIQDNGSVSSIVDPRQSPHHFTMSPSDRIALSQADMAVWIGPLFETYLTDFFMQKDMQNKTTTLIEAPGLLLHNITDNQIDAHLWLDLSNAVKIAEIIAERVISLDPQHEESYRNNLSMFEANIMNTILQIEQKLSTQPKADYAVYHNAFQYFERQFGLQHAIVILQDPEIQPSMREVVQLRQQFQQQAPSCLLSEIDESADLVNTVLNGHELRSIPVDLLGYRVSSDRDGYIQFISNIADDFIRCLYE